MILYIVLVNGASFSQHYNITTAYLPFFPDGINSRENVVESEEVVVTMMSTCDKALVPWNWCMNNEWFLNHRGHIDFDSGMKVTITAVKKSMLNFILHFTK